MSESECNGNCRNCQKIPLDLSETMIVLSHFKKELDANRLQPSEFEKILRYTVQNMNQAEANRIYGCIHGTWPISEQEIMKLKKIALGEEH